MGCRKFLASLIRDIGKQYNPMETDEDKKKVIEIVNPRQGYGGFVELGLAVVCDCGSVLAVCASAPKHTKEEVDDIIKKSESMIEVKIGKHPDCPDDAQLRHASNMGHTAVKCDDCGASYIICWELEVCRVSRNVTLPWDSPEGPDYPSSEPSFSTRPRRTMVH